MKKLNRIFFLLLALVLLAGLFAGCGGTGSAGTEPPSEAQAQETEGPTAETGEPAESELPEDEAHEYILPLTNEEVCFSWFIAFPTVMGMYFDAPYYDYPALQEVSDLTGVEIEWYSVSNEAEQDTFNIMLAGGDVCDVFDSKYLTGGLDSYVEQEIILDLKDAIQENMPYYLQAAEEYEGFAEALGTESDAGYWSVIYTYTVDAPINAGLVIRQDWLDALNLEAPVTYDDFYEVLKAFNSEYGAVMWNYSTAVDQYNFLCSGYGIYGAEVNGEYAFYNENGVIQYGPYTEAFREYLTMMNQWYSEGLLEQDFISTSTDIKSELVTTDRAGIWYSTLTNLNEYDGMSQDEDFSISPLADAVQEEGDVLHFKIADAALSSSNCISAQCENVELLLQFIDFMFTDEGTVLRNWGIEGVSWEADANGEPQFNDFILNPPELPALSLAITAYTAGTLPGITLSSRMDVAYSAEQLDAMKVWESNSDDAYLLPSQMSLNEEESAVISSYMGDISTYISEMAVGMIMGTVSLDEYDTYMETLRELNIEVCIAAYQSALDRYMDKLA